MSLGLYIHIPFCQTRCNYCHFVTRPWQAGTAERYYQALLREIHGYSSELPEGAEADTVYIGGGTPSIVPAQHITGILDACREIIPIKAGSEITIEANPGSLSREKADAYNRSGVNRVSLGAQSFDDAELTAIGRDHSGNQVDESVELLRSCGILNVSLDLLLGLPGQTQLGWETSLKRAVQLKPAHISVYMLDLDERSSLFHLIAKGRHKLPDDDLVADLYLQTRDQLGRNGYEQYEISNFALSGFQSRHNLKYWNREPVIGFGVGSHSYDGRARFANLSRISAYLEAAEAGRKPVDWRRPVLESQGLEETLFLGLRLNRGIDWSRIRREHPGAGQIAGFEAALRDLSDRGLLEWHESVVRLTPGGMLLSNEVFREFV